MTIWEAPRQLRRQITDRIAAGEVTQAALARETGITQGTISNILTGRKACRMRTLYMIGEAAGIYATVRLDQHELRAGRFAELDKAIARDREPV